MSTFRSALRPSALSLAYALFLATNAACVWGGVFPFLPFDYQTTQLLLWFFLAQATAFALTYFFTGFAAYAAPHLLRRAFIAAAAGPYLLGWGLLIASMYLRTLAIPLTIGGGLFLGFGAAGFYLLWHQCFAAREGEGGTRDLIVGTMYAALIYLALYLVPRAIVAYLIPLVFMPLFGLAIVLASRSIDPSLPMMSDAPKDNPHVHRKAFHLLWRSTACIASLGFCTGTMRALAINEPMIGTYVNVLSMLSLLAVSFALLLLWQVKSLRLDILGMYRIALPVLLAAVVLMAFLSKGYLHWLAATLYGLYCIALLLLMIQTGQMSRDRGINPLLLFGIAGGCVFLAHDLGFIVGNLLESVWVSEGLNYAAVALVLEHLLAISFIGTQFRIREVIASAFNDHIELVKMPAPEREAPSVPEKAGAPNAGCAHEAEHARTPGEGGASETRRPQSGAGKTPRGDAQGPRRFGDAPDSNADTTPSEPVDELSDQLERLKVRYALSTREIEIIEQVARGKTVTRIAEDLFISENTARTHMKRIYAKLGVHKKMEMLDLLALMGAEG
ncbi:helix-turn-helix transcriptional regulator [Berryella wangjianweii]|uniref:helix-turn-helix transcriptional regulator n=1 Tax=Berryella wangjianweii TaxID=2734634 RepID=UPI0021BDBE09|nr:helix-turn-helix transcriptional regulator [Berryella wangjianweii]